MKLFDLFLKPDWLWNILWLLPLLAGLYIFSASKRKKLLQAILGERANSPDFVNLSRVKRGIKTLLVVLALVFIIIAAARPFWGNEIIPWSGTGRDIMFVLDVSRSMLAEDVKPSRIDHARWFVKELVKSMHTDRYGLVAFSGSAFLQCPMTIDKTSFFQVLDEMRPGIIPLGGTNIQNAIEVALKAFQAAEGTHRAIVLITDGDELQGNMSLMAKELNERKIPLYVVGVGDPSQPGLIMVTDENTGRKVFLKDKNGELVKSPINEAALKKFASECHDGMYVRSTAVVPNLDALQEKIKALVPEKYQSGQNTRPIERFHIPLFIAVLLLLISMSFGELRSTATILMLAFFLNPILLSQEIAPPANDQQSSLPIPKEKNIENEKQEMPAASMQTKEKLAPFELFNNGLDKHRANEREKAIELYQKAINSASPDDRKVRASAYQNLGAIFHEQGREILKSMELDKAQKAFEEAGELYREAMSFGENNSRDLAMNQQKLLNDLKIIEELRKQQKEMQNKKQEAQEKIQEAQKENQNAKGDSQGQQENAEQKKQDQQKGEKTDMQKSESADSSKDNVKEDKAEKAKEKTEEAKKSVEEYKKQAENLNSQKDKEAAELAQKKLEEALKNQENKDFNKAQENLDKALQALAEEPEKDEKEQAKNEAQAGKKEQAQKDEKSSEEKQQAVKAEEAKEKKEDEIDPEQADALLDLMEKDEKNFRNEIRESNRRASSIKEVEKDW